MRSETLLRILADGAWHAVDGLSAASVRQHAAQFHAWGLTLKPDGAGRCRLDRPLDLIDQRQLRDALHATASGDLGRLIIRTQLRSTNDELLRAASKSEPELESEPEPGTSAGDGWLDVCIAEFQSAGRGRRGRRWQAPLASGLCLSAGCRLMSDFPGLAVLPLVTGVTVRRVIRELTGVAVGLKWPNDLVWQDRKLGGILVERAVAGDGSSQVVVGIGLNVALPDAIGPSLSDWVGGAADLAGLARRPGAPGAESDCGAGSHSDSGPGVDVGVRPLPARTALASALAHSLWRMLSGVRSGTMPLWQDEWRAADVLTGRGVRVLQASGEFEGRAVGVDSLGALLVEDADGVKRRVTSGEARVRRGTGAPQHSGTAACSAGRS